jgi:hypothetical protein
MAMTDRDFVTMCLREIFEKNGYEDPQQLAQRDFEHISAEIAAKTTILISVATLKRLMQGRFARLPQTATLNAISQYLGYSNWQEYKITARRKSEAAAAAKPAATKSELPVERAIKVHPVRKTVPLALLVGACLVLLIGYSVIQPANPNYDKATFSFRKTTGNDIPNTVVFSYDVDEVNADSFFIQQSWDWNRRVRVDKNQYTLTDTYYEPGYHTAKLIANDSIIKTVGVSIPTNGWFFYSKRDFFAVIPKYITTDGRPGDGTLSLTPRELSADTGERYYFYLNIPPEAQGSADDYRFKARVKVEPLGTSPCPFVIPEVFCENGAMYIKATLKGCTGESLLQFGDHHLNGRTADLSALGIDVTNWIDIELVCKNKEATVYYDGTAVLSLTYDQSAGRIAGFGFISNGLCKVDFVELMSMDNVVIYSNDFGGEVQ